jgi:hypothetical protein
MERCYARDHENLTKYPNPQWISGQPLETLRRRFCKKHTQEEAKNLAKGIYRSAPQPSNHLGMSASCQQGQGKSPSDYNNPYEPCDWCGGPHLESRCFAKDPENVWKWPQRCWVKGPPPSILKRFSVALPRDPNRFRRSAPTV